jgi:hypothetical protein
MLTRLLHHIRQNLVAWIALFVALGGTGYAAVRLPAGSVGARQLKNGSITAAKLNPTSVAASVRAWAILTWTGTWRVRASSSDIRVASAAGGEVINWRHTRFARNCMASVTPVENLTVLSGSSSFKGFVTTSFDGPSGFLAIDGFAPNGTPQVQSVNVLVVCPSVGSQKVSR